MPFKSKRQQRAAFGGHIPGISKEKAKEWADETDDFKALPDRAPAEKGKPTLLSKRAAVLRGSKTITSAIGQRPEHKGVKSVSRPELENEEGRSKLKRAGFAKLADLLMGMGEGAGQFGRNASSEDKDVKDVPVNSTHARGSKKKHSGWGKLAGMVMVLGESSRRSRDGQSTQAPKLQTSGWATPAQSKGPRGPGVYTPPRPKKPGASIKKQSVNPRKNLRDAMSQGIA